MRKTLACLLALFSLTFVAACGASGGSDAKQETTTTAGSSKATTTSGGDTTTTEGSTTTEASTTTDGGSTNGDAVPVDTWADDFCTGFGGWITDIKTLGTNASKGVQPGDIEGAKAAIVKLFGDASDRTKTLIDDVDAAGVPDIKNGDQLVEDLKVKFEAFDTAIAQAQSDAEGLATNDPQAFQTKVKALTTQFSGEVQKVGDSFSELDAKYQSAELNSALSSSCNF